MINRIRDIRLQKGFTLAEVAAACIPPTTAQTVGRLETGTRTLSLGWMNRIAAALGVEPELLLRSDAAEPARIVAALTAGGAEPARDALEAVSPMPHADGESYVVMTVEASCGEYRAGDQLWLRRHALEDASRLVNRDVLVPRTGGRFAFGRLFDAQGARLGLLPPASGQRQVIVDSPEWVAAAEMLVRRL
jgi:transcriptional regulator with XRE-family HTH domain